MGPTIESWATLVHCARCDALGVAQPLVPCDAGVLHCPACLQAGRGRVVATEAALLTAWCRRLGTLHFDRVALRALGVLLEVDDPGLAEIVGRALEHIAHADAEDRVELLGCVATSCSWDGRRLEVSWRQPFDLLVDAMVPFGGNASESDLDAVFADWLERAGPGLFEAVVNALVPAEQASTRGRRPRRRELGPCNVLTISEAVAELGMCEADGREWLEAKGLVNHPGRARRTSGRVIAADLVEAIKACRGEPEPRRRAPPKVPFPKTSRF